MSVAGQSILTAGGAISVTLAIHTTGKIMGFVVALNRDRDSYQVPIALAEVGQLDRFVTDYYEGRGVRLPSLGHRRDEAIPPELVSPSITTVLHQLPYEVANRRGPAEFPTYRVEKVLGAAVAKVARRTPESSLLLYSGSALEGFLGPSTGRRILFQYHPGPAYLEMIMDGLDELEDAGDWVAQAEVLDPRMEQRHQAEVDAADSYICASSLTARGLIHNGADPDLVSVVPYGCPAPTSLAKPAPTERVRFLFVGKGSQRKGLHLLLEAWRRAALADAELVLVTNFTDPAIEQIARSTEGVTIRSKLSRDELSREFVAADTFVLPSLLEGFGLVLGEALAHGCRIIATGHTGLVDLQLPDQLASVIEPGRVQPIVEALTSAHASARPDRPYHEDALEHAQRISWSSFRAGIRQAAGCSDEVAV